MFYAHSLTEETDKSNWHTLKDHLSSTGLMSGQFAAIFRSENAARLAGLLHDLGKYSAEFQAYIEGKRPKGGDHSTAGAKEILALATTTPDKIVASIIAFAIAGHHAGLADTGGLQDRLGKPINAISDLWRKEVDTNVGPLWPAGLDLSTNSKETCAFQLAFWGRMVFSCLVDADYKDTERFYAAHDLKMPDRNWPDLNDHIDTFISKFDAHMAGKSTAGSLNALRGEILSHVRSKAIEPTGLFTLTVPTGGGKTLASLGFALDHARTHRLRRIVYAIPFTSIIDQTAGIFRDVLGEDYVLEHHSSIDEEKNQNREQKDKLKLAMEDWAAPVVVTTNVQLFESLFANRPSKCRKLHNLTGSIIILDEAQTLPMKYLRPCLAALDELTRNYGCTIVLCTATQPALDVRDFKHGGLPLEGRELAPDPTELSRQLKRVHISTGHVLEDDQLVDALGQQDQGLIIVNSRKHALSLYQSALRAGLEGMVHLTTRQYAAHRREILTKVRADLKDGKPSRLIATSLIEAGVDVDFPRVWRAEAGLDQIAQAAGRCNREGRRPVADSLVTVFSSKDNPPPPEVRQLAADFARIADAFTDDLLSPEAMKAYFREVFWRKGAEQLDEKKILDRFMITGGKPLFEFQTVAQDFRLIESGLMPIIIPDNPTVQAVLGRLNSAEVSAGKAARDLQTFIVQVPPKFFNALRSNGRVTYHRPDLWGDQFAVLSDLSLYKPDTGLLWENADVLEDTIWGD